MQTVQTSCSVSSPLHLIKSWKIRSKILTPTQNTEHWLDLQPKAPSDWLFVFKNIFFLKKNNSNLFIFYLNLVWRQALIELQPFIISLRRRGPIIQILTLTNATCCCCLLSNKNLPKIIVEAGSLQRPVETSVDQKQFTIKIVFNDRNATKPHRGKIIISVVAMNGITVIKRNMLNSLRSSSTYRSLCNLTVPRQWNQGRYVSVPV